MTAGIALELATSPHTLRLVVSCLHVFKTGLERQTRRLPVSSVVAMRELSASRITNRPHREHFTDFHKIGADCVLIFYFFPSTSYILGWLSRLDREVHPSSISAMETLTANETWEQTRYNNGRLQIILSPMNPLLSERPQIHP